MEELFYSSGKIYVVTGVIAIILIGVLSYLFYIDRKVSKLEKKIKENSNK